MSPEMARALRSLDIVVIRRGEGLFEALNPHNGHSYNVIQGRDGLHCECVDHRKGNRCKHIWAVKTYQPFFFGVPWEVA